MSNGLGMIVSIILLVIGLAIVELLIRKGFQSKKVIKFEEKIREKPKLVNKLPIIIPLLFTITIAFGYVLTVLTPPYIKNYKFRKAMTELAKKQQEKAGLEKALKEKMDELKIRAVYFDLEINKLKSKDLLQVTAKYKTELQIFGFDKKISFEPKIQVQPHYDVKEK